MSSKSLTIKRLVAFCILMQNNGGILNKAPSYLLEKYEAVMNNKYPEAYLDVNNLAIFKEYLKKWRVDNA
ncbi:MAG: hypothetical protein DRP62_01495 [Planctomycetota bacterium]|nr:MAG: hypothetical protein DRP62_01495 [Planctomycetota bacterium]